MTISFGQFQLKNNCYTYKMFFGYALRFTVFFLLIQLSLCNIFSDNLNILHCFMNDTQPRAYLNQIINSFMTEVLIIQKPEAVVRSCSVKMVLLKISQNSQKSTCLRVPLLTFDKVAGLLTTFLNF